MVKQDMIRSLGFWGHLIVCEENVLFVTTRVRHNSSEKARGL